MGRFNNVGEDLDLAFGQTLNDNFAKADAALTANKTDITQHKASSQAHAADTITYSGEVIGAGNVKDAIDSVKNEVRTIVAHAGDGTKDTEIVLARKDAPTLGDRLDGVDAQLAETARGKIISPLYIETFDGSNEAYHPSGVYFENGWNGYKRWVAYTPLPYLAAPYIDRWECPSIAASNDGKTWVLPAGFSNPLHDLTPEEIARGDYFSDTSITMNGNIMEVWYRHTNGANPSNTNIYRVTSTDSKNWSAPEMVQDSQNSSVVVTPSGGNFFRSQSVILLNGIYTAYYAADTGVFKMQSTNPSNKVWTNRVQVTLNGSVGTPWHLSVVYDGVYHLIGYFNNNNNNRVQYYVSTDGVSFNFVKTLVSLGEKKYSNLVGLYQSTVVKVSDGWEAYISVELDAHPNGIKRALALMKGPTIDSLVFVDVGNQKNRQEFLGDIVLQNSLKPNAKIQRLVLNLDDQGNIVHAIGLREQLGKLVPTYFGPAGVQNLVSAFITGGVPSAYPFRNIGEIHINQADTGAFYFSTASGKWIRLSTEALIKNGRQDANLATSITITNKVYRVVINTATNGVVNLERIEGATEGQEIIVFNAIETTPITIRHNTSTAGGYIRLRGAANKTLAVYETVKLHFLNGNWYEV